MSNLDDFLKQFDEEFKPGARQKVVMPTAPLDPVATPVAITPTYIPQPRPVGPLDAVDANLRGFIDEFDQDLGLRGSQAPIAPSPFDAFLESFDRENGLENLPASTGQSVPEGNDATGAGRPPAGQNEAPPSQSGGLLENFVSGVQDIASGVGRGFNRGQANEAASRLAAGQLSGQTITGPEAAAEIARQSQEAARYQESEELKRQAAEYQRTTGGLDSLVYLLEHPRLTGTVIAEGLAESPESIVGGAVGGFAGGPIGGAAGVAIGSSITGVGGALLDYLKTKHNIDPSDEEQLQSAFANPEMMAEAKAYAGKKGFTTGLIDGVFTMLGGRAVRTVNDKLGKKVPGLEGSQSTRFSQTAAAGAGVGTEAVGGATGEAASSVVVGERIDAKNLWLEGLAELGGGSAELVSSGVLGGERSASRLVAPTADDFRDAAGAPIVEEREVDFEEAEAEGRILYGVDDGSGIVDLDDYDIAEKKVFEKGARNGRLIAVRPEDASPEASLDFDKLKALPHNERQKFRVLADEDTNTRLQLALNGLANQPARREESLAKIKEILSTTEVDPNSTSLPIFTLKFVGDTRPLGVRFKQVDYGNLVVDSPLDIQPEVQIKWTGKERTSQYDLDMKKLTPGAFQPSLNSIVNAAKSMGEAEVIRLATEGGSTDVEVERLRSVIRNPGDWTARTAVLDDLDTGRIRFTPDPRLYTEFGTIKRADEVKAAVVRKPQGKVGRFKDTDPNIFQWGQYFRTSDGKAGTATALDLGNVLGVVDRKKAAAFRAAVEAMQDFITRTNLPFNVAVIPWTKAKKGVIGIQGDPENNAGFNPSNVAKGVPKGTSIIYIDMEGEFAAKDAVDVYRTLFHEFGHFISASGFWMQTPETRTRLMAAYRRALQSTTSMNPYDVESRIGAFRRPDPAYIFTFEEWFAEQTARWASTNRRPVGFVAKVARQVARLLLEAAKTFKTFDPTNGFLPEPEVNDFFNAAVRGKSRGDWFNSVVNQHETETRTRNENAVRGQDLGPMTPMTPQSVGMRESFAKLGVEKIEDMARTMGVTVPSIPASLAAVDRFNWFYKWFLSMPQVAEMNPDLTELQQYRELIQSAQVEQTQIMTAAHERLTQWRNLGTKQAEALGQLLFWATQMNYRTAAEVAAGVVRQPTAAELQAEATRLGLSQDGVRMYGNIRKDFHGALDRYMGLLIEAANQIADPADKAARLADINRTYTSMLKRPYFPMTRYGKWSLDVKENGQLRHFELFESKRQRDAALKLARQTYPAGSGYVVHAGMLHEEATQFIGVPPQMLDLIGSTLQLSNDQRQALDQIKFQLAPEQSFRKRFLNRREIPGWSEDAQRNYAHYFFHHAKHHMRVKYQRLLADQVKSLKALRATRPISDKLDGIVNFLNHHMQEFLNPKADLAALRSAAAIWHLGFVPQSAVLNLTQLAVATTPFLAAKFGDLKTSAAMLSASKALTNFYSKGTINARASTTQGRTGQLYRALSQGVSEGVIDESQAVELAGLAEGNHIFGAVPAGGIRKGWAKFASAAMVMFQQTEQYNRRVTFRAAWQLAMDNPTAPWMNSLRTKHALQYNRLINQGWSDLETMAFLAAKDTVVSTQFEYSRYARPRFMQGRAGALFIFQLFTQNMLFLGIKNWNSIGPRMLLTMAFMGGLMALPGMEDADELIKAIAGKFGKEFDLEREARKMVVEVLGPEGTDLVMRGLTRDSLNLGVLHDIAGITAFPQIDMSRQVGMGRVLPINPALLLGSPGVAKEKAIADAVSNAAGAGFGPGFNLVMAVQDSDTPFGDLKRWERAMPRSVRNAYRAGSTFSEGGPTDSSGAVITKFDPQDPQQAAEMAAMALGFNPTRVSREWDVRIAEIEVNQFWEARRAIVMDQFARAIRKKDPDMIREARAALRDFNKETPYKEKAISADGLKRSVQQRAEKRVLSSRGKATNPTGVRVNKEMRELFPGAIDVRKVKTMERPTS